MITSAGSFSLNKNQTKQSVNKIYRRQSETTGLLRPLWCWRWDHLLCLTFLFSLLYFLVFTSRFFLVLFSRPSLWASVTKLGSVQLRYIFMSECISQSHSTVAAEGLQSRSVPESWWGGASRLNLGHILIFIYAHRKHAELTAVQLHLQKFILEFSP